MALSVHQTAPTGAPISLLIESTTSTSVTLSWSSPPQHQLNGVLRNYVVIIQELDTGRNSSLTSIHSQIVIGDLHPFYTYNFSVCAVTTDIGPCTYFEQVQLPQDGKLDLYVPLTPAACSLLIVLVPTGAPESVAATSVSSTTVLLTWNPPPPDLQNGIITTYYVNMTELETGMASQMIVAGATQLLIDILHPYYVYNFYISAATTIGRGPYSPVFSIQTPEDG